VAGRRAYVKGKLSGMAWPPLGPCKPGERRGEVVAEACKALQGRSFEIHVPCTVMLFFWAFRREYEDHPPASGVYRVVCSGSGEMTCAVNHCDGVIIVISLNTRTVQ